MVARWHCARCPNCKFEFHGGHDHHTFSEAFLCLDCLAVFELVTQNEYGATAGELVPVFRRVEKWRRFRLVKQERVPVNATAFAVPGEIEYGGRRITEAIAYDLRDFQCECGSGQFTFELKDGTACPKCKVAKLQVSDVIY